MTASASTYFPTAADFCRWLTAHHATAPELLVGFWMKGSGKPSIDWPQARNHNPAQPGPLFARQRLARHVTPA